jgi:voltage-gated potassium channel
MSLERRLLNIVLLFASVITFGGVGYILIEGWSWIDAFYMAIITVTTVGFAEVHPLTPAGRLFTAVLVLLGVGSITYAFTALTNYLIAGELGDVLQEFKMKRQIDALKEHYIVCGFGRVGEQVCVQLSREGRAFVVVEKDEAVVALAREQGYLAIHGDAGDDQVLHQASIHRARGLVAAVASDAGNLFVVLSSRALNRDLCIVARAGDEDATDKLLRAGADRVISPYSLGGRLIAQTLLRPGVVDFLDVVMYDDSLKLYLEDLIVGPGSSLDGLTVGQARIREKIGANILGIRRGGQVIVSPPASTHLQPGDILVALGTRRQLAALESLVRSPAPDGAEPRPAKQ